MPAMWAMLLLTLSTLSLYARFITNLMEKNGIGLIVKKFVA